MNHGGAHGWLEFNAFDEAADEGSVASLLLAALHGLLTDM
jgi:hypothetical protein